MTAARQAYAYVCACQHRWLSIPALKEWTAKTESSREILEKHLGETKECFQPGYRHRLSWSNMLNCYWVCMLIRVRITKEWLGCLPECVSWVRAFSQAYCSPLTMLNGPKKHFIIDARLKCTVFSFNYKMNTPSSGLTVIYWNAHSADTQYKFNLVFPYISYFRSS